MYFLHSPRLFIIDKLKEKKKIPASHYFVYYTRKKYPTGKKRDKINLGANLTPNSSCQ